MLTHTEIVDLLNREVYSSRERLTEARRDLDAIIAELPGTLPHPDGQHRLTNAIKEHITARDALELALKRNCELTLNGIIPEDAK